MRAYRLPTLRVLRVTCSFRRSRHLLEQVGNLACVRLRELRVHGAARCLDLLSKRKLRVRVRNEIEPRVWSYWGHE